MLNLRPKRLDAEDFREQPIDVCGKAFIALLSGALYWPSADALIVADLHLERPSGRARTLPSQRPFEARETLARLAAALDQTQATTLIALDQGRADGEPLNDDAARALSLLQEDRDWLWITGHNETGIATRLGGQQRADLTVDGITLRATPAKASVTHEIAGGSAPLARHARLGHTLSRPCFVGNGRRLILPAFGLEAGGHNILGDTFAPLFASDGLQAWMLGHDGLYPVAARLLRED